MDDRRKRERRSWGITPTFPFYDSSGTFVRSDRRKLAERRVGNIQINETTADANGAGCLILGYHKEMTNLSPGLSCFTIGRSSKCDLVVDNRYASRVHARFEYNEENGFILIDQSSNGTDVRHEDGKEERLVGNRIFLSGVGLISLGAPCEYNKDHIIEFFCEPEIA